MNNNIDQSIENSYFSTDIYEFLLNHITLSGVYAYVEQCGFFYKKQSKASEYVEFVSYNERGCLILPKLKDRDDAVHKEEWFMPPRHIIHTICWVSYQSDLNVVIRLLCLSHHIPVDSLLSLIAHRLEAKS